MFRVRRFRWRVDVRARRFGVGMRRPTPAQPPTRTTWWLSAINDCRFVAVDLYDQRWIPACLPMAEGESR